MYADQEQPQQSASNVRRRRGRPGAMRTQANKVSQLKQYRQTRSHPYAAPGGSVGSGRRVVIRASQLQAQQQQPEKRLPGIRVTGLDQCWTPADLKEIFGSQGFSPQAVKFSGRGSAILNYGSNAAAAHVAKEMDGAQVDGRAIRCTALDTATGVRRNKADSKQQQQQYFWQAKKQRGGGGQPQQQQKGGQRQGGQAQQQQGGGGRRRRSNSAKKTDGQKQQQQSQNQQQQQGGGRGGNRSRSSRRGGRGGRGGQPKEEQNPEVERSNLDAMLDKYIGETQMLS